MRYLLVPFLLLSFSLNAQLPDPVLTAKERREIAEAFAAQVEKSYVFPDKGTAMAKAIREKVAAGAYDTDRTAEEFVTAVVNDARAVTNDRHLRLAITKEVLPEETEEARKKRRERPFAGNAHRINFGIPTAKVIEGNVGYIDVELFPPPQFAGPVADAAMAFLANTDALIIDARRHRGGDPAMVAHFVSHFVQPGTLINTIYKRDTGETREYRAVKTPTKPYEKKVWVLTSRRTFSGGEELAYDLQALKRATIVGEVTGGGAHPTSSYRIHPRFMAAIPNDRSINPITKTNWEGIGVKPDVAVASADALRVAHTAALETLAAAASDPEWREQLTQALSNLKSQAAPAESDVRTPARDALDAWVKSFNEHDLEARRKWLRENTTFDNARIEQFSSMDVEIRDEHGAFEVVRAGKVTATSAEVFARHKRSGMGARIAVELDKNDPKKIGMVTLEPTPVEAKGNPAGPR